MSVIDISRKEKYSRCVGLEEDYVHQVYEKIGKDLAHAKHPLETTIKNFLDKLEPGSLVADIGCGDGRYLCNNDRVFSLGADSSGLQASLARQKCQETLLGDNLCLPFRGNAFDAVLSVSVIHHFTTQERRIKALKELARILRIGGRVLIAVQQHNSQNSQDVLIPWFDVPKDKKQKDNQWLEQDSGEYDLEDERNEDEDEEDSISLPSSDDEDTQWTTFPKQFPPKCYAKPGWNSERHSRSLDYGYQPSSNLVPNTNQLVQTNACYAFVRKALKRFSSVNNADEEPYIASEIYQSVDSAVPPSPLCIQDQNFEIPISSSSNSEDLQKMINENFIELLNIDEDQRGTNLFPNCVNSFERANIYSHSGNSFTKDKKPLIRSLSDIFKNMNSLWSSKGTKSCSDLKSQVLATDNNLKDRIGNKNRLVRSQTTATCNTEIDYLMPLEDIQELDMTVSEANKIINNFLETSMPSIETVNSECVTNEFVPPQFNQFDIANGNTLSLNKSLVNVNYSKKLHKYEKENKSLERQMFEKENISHVKSKYDFLRKKKLMPYESDICSENYILRNELNPCLYKLEEICLNVDKELLHTKIPCKSDHLFMESTNSTKVGKNKHKTELLQKYSFQIDEKLDNSELTKLKDLDFSIKNNETKDLEISKDQIVSSKLKDKDEPESILIGKENIYIETKLKSDFDEQTHLNLNTRETENKENNPREILSHECAADPIFYEKCENSKDRNLEEEEEVVYLDIKHCKKKNPMQISGNINGAYFFHNSPKRINNLCENLKMPASKTLGPFYDEDNDEVCNERSLASYYSMPELHALSEFYREYNVYQTHLVNNATAEFSTSQNDYCPKTDNILINGVQKFNQEFLDGTDSLLLSKPGNSNFYFSDSKSSLYSSTNLPSNSSLYEHDIDNRKEVSAKFPLNDNESYLVTSPKHSFEILLKNKKRHRSAIDSISYTKSKQDFAPIVGRMTSKIARSHSIGCLEENTLKINFSESHIVSKLHLSHPSLFISQKSLENLFSVENHQNCVQNDSNNSNFINALNKKRSVSDAISKKNLLNFEKDLFRLHNNSVLYNANINCTSISNTDISQNNCCNKSFDISDSKKDSVDKSYLRPLKMQNLYSELVSLSPNNEAIEVEQDRNILVELKNKNCGFTKTNLNNDSSTAFHREPHKVFENAKSDKTEVLISSIEFLEDSYSEKYAIDNLPEIDAKEFQTICDGPIQVFSRNDNNQINPTKKVECLHSFPEENFFQQCLDSTMTPPGDISGTVKNNPLASDAFSISSETDLVNGAKITKNSLITECSEIGTPPAVTTKNCIDSNLGVTICKKEESKHFDSSITVHDPAQTNLPHSIGLSEDNVNYAYGRIQEDGASVVIHRYHHLFDKEELENLIENSISDLHVLNSFQEGSHWCVIAEKVRVWTI